jgi:hypothetical protein
MRKQMHKIHKPHLDSGYLSKVSYQSYSDADGQPDWWMLYVPGPRAKAEYEYFNQRKGARKQLREGGNALAEKREPGYSAEALALVRLFYELRYNQPDYTPPPQSNMLKDAEYLLAKHGREKARQIVRFAVEQGRGKPEEAQVRWFQGVLSFEGQALAALQRQQRREQWQSAQKAEVKQLAEERYRLLRPEELAERRKRANELIEICNMAHSPEWNEAQRPELIEAFVRNELEDEILQNLTQQAAARRLFPP